jgi:hypothetical protein
MTIAVALYDDLVAAAPQLVEWRHDQRVFTFRLVDANAWIGRKLFSYLTQFPLESFRKIITLLTFSIPDSLGILAVILSISLLG